MLRDHGLVRQAWLLSLVFPEHQRACDEDTGERAGDHAGQKHEGKGVDRAAPNRNSDPAASRVVPEVMIVRLSVLLMALFMISVNVPFTFSFKSSRMRSKMTIVSLIEKPMIVRTAAITGALNSPPHMKKIPSVISTSWQMARMAPSANENS